jgi:hypothetical protein
MMVKECAAQLGAGVRTVHDWLEKPDFVRLISRYRSKLISETLGKLSNAGVKAVETLIDALESQESDGIKVRAALGILDQLVRIRETTELEQRLVEVEGRVARVDQESN